MSVCRCDAMRFVYGAEGPSRAPIRCGVCSLEDAVEKLYEEGFVSIFAGHRLAYQDCGVEVRSLGYLGDARSWVPGWAADIVAVLHVAGDAGGYCGPVLKRAVEDETFRHAFEAVMRLVSDEPGAEQRARLNAFAASQGLTPLAVAVP